MLVLIWYPFPLLSPPLSFPMHLVLAAFIIFSLLPGCGLALTRIFVATLGLRAFNKRVYSLAVC